MNLYADPSRPCPEGWTLARTPNEALAILAKGGVQRMAIGIDGPDAKAWRRLVPRMARAGTWPTERPSVHGSDARSVCHARAPYVRARSAGEPHDRLMAALDAMTPDEVFQTSVDAGIHSADGRLTKPYRSTKTG